MVYEVSCEVCGAKNSNIAIKYPFSAGHFNPMIFS